MDFSMEQENPLPSSSNDDDYVEQRPKKLKKRDIKKKERRKSCDRWTAHEDELLFQAIQIHGERNWNDIAKLVGTKNGDQCNQHWHRVLNPKISKTPWTTEEDLILLERVDLFGGSAWKTVAEGFEGRTDIQCRHRWTILQKNPKNTKKLLGKKRKSVNSSEQRTAVQRTSKPVEEDNQQYMQQVAQQEQYVPMKQSDDSPTTENNSSTGTDVDEIFDFACKQEQDTNELRFSPVAFDGALDSALGIDAIPNMDASFGSIWENWSDDESVQNPNKKRRV